MAALRRNGSKDAGGAEQASGPGGGASALPRPVVLVGLPGAGKTRVGRALAARLGVAFADNDSAIVDAAGMDIPSIFEAYGEAAFRDLEAKVLAGMLDRPPSVVSTGGGAFMSGESRALIAERGISLWLKAEPATLAGRISNFDSRPLLKGRDPVEALAELAEKRHPVYAEADLAVDTDGLEVDEAVDKVERELLGHIRRAGAAR